MHAALHIHGTVYDAVIVQHLLACHPKRLVRLQITKSLWESHPGRQFIANNCNMPEKADEAHTDDATPCDPPIAS